MGGDIKCPPCRKSMVLSSPANNICSCYYYFGDNSVRYHLCSAASKTICAAVQPNQPPLISLPYPSLNFLRSLSYIYSAKPIFVLGKKNGGNGYRISLFMGWIELVFEGFWWGGGERGGGCFGVGKYLGLGAGFLGGWGLVFP